MPLQHICRPMECDVHKDYYKFTTTYGEEFNVMECPSYLGDGIILYIVNDKEIILSNKQAKKLIKVLKKLVYDGI